MLEGERGSLSAGRTATPRRDSFAKWTSPEREGEGFDFAVPRESRSEEMVGLGALEPVHAERANSYC